jgi:hypothetical protein
VFVNVIELRVRRNSTPVAESKSRTFTAAKNGGQIEWQPD